MDSYSSRDVSMTTGDQVRKGEAGILVCAFMIPNQAFVSKSSEQNVVADATY